MPPLLTNVLPWLHEDSSKVDLSMKVNIQHLLQVVLMSNTERCTTRRLQLPYVPHKNKPGEIIKYIDIYSTKC